MSWIFCNFPRPLLYCQGPHSVCLQCSGSVNWLGEKASGDYDDISLMAILHDNRVSLTESDLSPFWTLLELSIMEVVETTGAIGRAKLQLNRYPPTNQQPLFYRQMKRKRSRSVKEHRVLIFWRWRADCSSMASASSYLVS